MPIPELVIASANPDKVAEIAVVLENLAVLIPRPEGMSDVVEDGDDLEDNARLKAVAVVNSPVDLQWLMILDLKLMC